MSIRSHLLNNIPGIRHGFGTLEHPVPAELAADWEKLKPQWKQVHGTGLSQVTMPGQACGEADALWSDQSGCMVGVVTADCVPVLMASNDARTIAAVHSGWRGTLARIVPTVWSALQARQAPALRSSPEWSAAIGPSIKACCYEVSQEIIDAFLTEFRDCDPRKLNPAHRRLDLQEVILHELDVLGVRQVDVIRMCTYCGKDSEKNEATPLFNSYRRGQSTAASSARQWSIIHKL